MTKQGGAGGIGAKPGDESSITLRHVDLGGLRLHCAEAGAGPLVILLHGFPEFWYAWRHQIVALADAGFRVVAPDMRGYNLSDKPAGIDAYRTDLLCRDVADLIQALGADRAAVVGHDWGGVVSWLFAMRHPERLERLAILNCPHPSQFFAMLRDPRQLRRSWYVFSFQLPALPERFFRARDFAGLRAILRKDPVRSGAFSEDDIERYVRAAAQPGALTAAINYYRALVRLGPWRLRRELRRIDAPVQVIWGERDRYLGPDLASPPAAWVPDARVERLPDASHWVQADRPDRVNALLIEFLSPLQH